MPHPTPSRRQILGTSAVGVIAAASTPSLRAADLAPAAAAAVPAAEPAFKLGLVTYNVGAQLDLPSLLTVCKAAGVAAVELRTTHKHGVEPTLSKDGRADVRKRFADAGVVMWGCGSVCEFQAPDPAVVRQNVEACKRFVELVADVGGRGVKVRPNGLPRGVPQEKTLEQIGRALVPCGQAAADAGVEVWVEVHGGGTSHPPHMKAIMEHCGHKAVGVTWNSNDTDLKAGRVEEHFRLLRPWILSCHINDLWKDAAGQYPYRELFRLFRETRYDRYTLCEVGTTMPDAATAEAFLRHYRALWASLAK